MPFWPLPADLVRMPRRIPDFTEFPPGDGSLETGCIITMRTFEPRKRVTDRFQDMHDDFRPSSAAGRQ